jgi:hypothetical protein
MDFTGEAAPTSDNRVSLSPKQGFIASSYLELVKATPGFAEMEIVLIEVPSLSENIFNQVLLQTANISYLVIDAIRTWSTSDEFLLDNIKTHITTGLYGILNKVSVYNIEDIAGEVPKKRSKFRKFIKQKLFKRLL